jgi:transposase-like protein
LEAEGRDALGRDYDERGAEPGQGYRNGYRQARLKTAEGAIPYVVPQITVVSCRSAPRSATI